MLIVQAMMVGVYTELLLYTDRVYQILQYNLLDYYEIIVGCN